MKSFSLVSLLAVFMCMVSIEVAAYDIAAVNEDGVTIYYRYINGGQELSVIYGGTDINFDSCYHYYSGTIRIPQSVDVQGEIKNVTQIGSYAFFACHELVAVSIPNGITTIGINAFRSCSNLTSINIPNSVTSINAGAFMDCGTLSSIDIPNSVVEIGAYVFENCYSLTSLAIPESVTSIHDYAFMGCKHLSSIVVNPLNKVYDSRENCNAIIETNSSTLFTGFDHSIIPNSITTIGENAFDGCTTYIDIPNNVTRIGDYAFSACTFTYIKVHWNRPLPINNNIFSNNRYHPNDLYPPVDKTTCVLYVPKGTAMMYMSAPVWMEFVNIIEYEDEEDGYYITIKQGDGGAVKQFVEAGNIYTYIIKADEGWNVNTVTFDGKDVTSQLLNGQYSTPVIIGNSELFVVFRQESDGIKNKYVSDVKVYAQNNAITITGADDNALVNVYNTNGALVKSFMGNSTISLNGGIYIVKVDKETFKVCL